MRELAGYLAAIGFGWQVARVRIAVQARAEERAKLREEMRSYVPS